MLESKENGIGLSAVSNTLTDTSPTGPAGRLGERLGNFFTETSEHPP